MTAAERVRNWHNKAIESIESDPVSSFISSWIAFNHTYSTHASNPNGLFRHWSEEVGQLRFGKRLKGDKAELEFFAISEECLPILKAVQADIESTLPSIKLPIRSVLYKTPVPDDTERTVNLFTLNSIDIFFTIYQIRNNLFHGSKDPRQSQRDLELCNIAAQFMNSLISKILEMHFKK